MTRYLLSAFALLLGTTALQASVFSFSYSGAGESVTGTLTATSTLPGIYTITGVSGTVAESGTTWTITGQSGSNTFIYSAGSGTGTVDFNVSSGASTGTDDVAFAGDTFAQTGTNGVNAGFNFVMTDPVAEPRTLLLLGSMGLGFWLLARKLPVRTRL